MRTYDLLTLLFVSSSACSLPASAQEAAVLGPEAVQLAPYPGAPFEDGAGDLWFSTVGAGLIRYDGERFVAFTRKDGLGDDSVRDVVEDGEGRIWVATTGGVSVFDGEGFETLTDYGDHPVTMGFAPEGNHRDVWDLYFDRDGLLWIATSGGVFRYVDGAFVRFALPVVASEGAFEFAPRMVYAIAEDRDGTLWFGTDGAGAVRYDGEGFEVFTTESHGLASDRVCTILEDARGHHWFGTSDGGVSRYDGERFTTHLRSSERSVHTGWGRCMAICEDPSGALWFGVAAAGGGVHRYDGERFRFLSRDAGLGDGGVPSIRLDRAGRLWLGTTSGVYRLDLGLDVGPEGERFVHFGRAP